MASWGGTEMAQLGSHQPGKLKLLEKLGCDFLTFSLAENSNGTESDLMNR